MNYFSFNDIVETHNISKEKLKQLCFSGMLKYIKIQTSRNNDKIFRYCIPEDELSKLAPFRNSEIKINPLSQPDYYTNLWAEQDKEKEKEKERYGHFIEERKKRVDYQEYLKSPEWKEKRDIRLALDGYTCRLCGSGKNLHVHHISYKNLGTPEEVDDLITLCEKCHARVHERDFERSFNNYD